MEKIETFQKLEKNINFVKSIAKWSGLTHGKIAEKLGIYRPDVTAVFSLKPRNKEHISKVLDFLGFKLKNGTLLYRKSVYFLVAKSQFLIKWSELYLSILYNAILNYYGFTATLYLFFNEKYVPFSLFVLNLPKNKPQEVYFLVQNRLKLHLASFIIEHFCTPFNQLLDEDLKKNESIFQIKAVFCSSRLYELLDKIFEKREEEKLKNFFKTLEESWENTKFLISNISILIPKEEKEKTRSSQRGPGIEGEGSGSRQRVIIP